MRVNATDKIVGIEAKHLRKFFRDHASGSQFNASSIKYWPELKLTSEQKIIKFFEDMIKEGYVSKEEHNSIDHYSLERKAMSLANTKFIKPILKEKATKVVEELLERVETMNTDKYYIMKVESIYVFGSYIDKDAKDFADINLIIKLKLKDGISYDESVKISQQRCPRASNFLERIGYALYQEPLKFLKNRNKYLSFCSDDKENFKCEKIYG
tara:strand:- start:660 stop:1295 length:636 start_codon:yes stop_codon:yes gene_type:complete